MTTRISRQTRRMAEIVETDRRQAVGAATEAIIARAMAQPIGYAELTAAAKAGAAGALLAGLTLPELRLVAIRWLVERGGAWTWGDVQYLQDKLVVQAAHAAVTATADGYEPDAAERAEAAEFCAACEAAPAAAPATRDAAPVSCALRAASAPQEAAQSVATTTATRRASGDLPVVELVAEALSELSRVSRQAGDVRAAKAFDKAAHWLGDGYATIRIAADGDMLIPSRSGGEVHRVSERGCSCKAGQVGAQCWAQALAEGIAWARDAAALIADDEAEYRRATHAGSERWAA
jgi:hypothetical protein